MEVAMSLRWMNLMLVPVALISCAQPSRSTPGEMAEPGKRATTSGVASVEYWRDVKPILEHRCVGCHGCYDAPCHPNITPFEGATPRGPQKKGVESPRTNSAGPAAFVYEP